MGSITEGLSSLRLAGLGGLQAPSGVAQETVHAAKLVERLVEVVVMGVYEHTRLPLGRFGTQGQPAVWVTGQAHPAPPASRKPNNRDVWEGTRGQRCRLSGVQVDPAEPWGGWLMPPLAAPCDSQARCDLSGLSGNRLVPGEFWTACCKALREALSWPQFTSVNCANISWARQEQR